MAVTAPTTAYDEALAFLYGRINYERTAIPPYRPQTFKLDRMHELVRRLDRPHVGLPILHVAGTKGKGSTSSMLASILTHAGFRTGLYTSPHLEKTEERLSVDGEICSPEELVDLVAQVRPVVEQMDCEAEASQLGHATFFEIMTALALLHFRRRRVDVVVLEVGLGGRLDSTNIVTPLVSVITSISFDHMKQLGQTLAAIAGEKAGIIKSGVPVVTGVTESEPLDVIAQVASDHDAPIYRAGVDFAFEFQPTKAGDALDKLPRGRMTYRGRVGERLTEHRDVEIGLVGRHQAANAAIALATLERLMEVGWSIPEAAIRAGLAMVRCPARIEVLQTAPTVLIDTAHNPASIAALVEVLTAARGFAQRQLLFACSKDKDAPAMLRQLWPHFDRVILTRFVNNPRSHTPEELAAIAATVAIEQGHQTRVVLAADPTSAWSLARDAARPDDLICITGSFFLAAEVRGLVGS